MCRMLAYMGAPVLLDHLLYAPDSSLLKQTLDAKMLGMLNLAGFGLAAWSGDWREESLPLCYRNTQVAVFDRNLKAISEKLEITAMISHLRGVRYRPDVQINLESVHPFQFQRMPLVMAHNGDIAHFQRIQFDLLPYIKPEFKSQLRTSIDSEWIYALLASALDDGPRTCETILDAITAALRILRQTRETAGIRQSSSVNLMAGDQNNLVVTRYAFDFGNYEGDAPQGASEFLSQWFTLGSSYGFYDGEWKMIGGLAPSGSIIVASEPLTRDSSTWVELPEYSALLISRAKEGISVNVVSLDV